MKISSLTLTFDHDLKINREHLLSRGNHYSKFINYQVIEVIILSIQHFSKTEFDLDLWPYELNINMSHLLSRGIYCTKFGNFPAKWSRDIQCTTFFSDQQLDLDLWPCEVKISRGHLLSRGIHCTKFGNFQVKVSKDIEWTSFGPQTDQQTVRPTDMPPFFKGGIKKTSTKKHTVIHIGYLFHFPWIDDVYNIIDGDAALCNICSKDLKESTESFII